MEFQLGPQLGMAKVQWIDGEKVVIKRFYLMPLILDTKNGWNDKRHKFPFLANTKVLAKLRFPEFPSVFNALEDYWSLPATDCWDALEL